jgi:hypothetical protein
MEAKRPAAIGTWPGKGAYHELTHGIGGVDDGR